MRSGLPPIDVVYLDDVSTIGPDVVETNERNFFLAEHLAEHGLSKVPDKFSAAVKGAAYNASLGSNFWSNDFLSPYGERLQRVKTITDKIIAKEIASPREKAAEVGGSVSARLVRRPLLPVLFRAYEFISSGA